MHNTPAVNCWTLPGAHLNTSSVTNNWLCLSLIVAHSLLAKTQTVCVLFLLAVLLATLGCAAAVSLFILVDLPFSSAWT